MRSPPTMLMPCCASSSGDVRGFVLAAVGVRAVDRSCSRSAGSTCSEVELAADARVAGSVRCLRREERRAVAVDGDVVAVSHLDSVPSMRYLAPAGKVIVEWCGTLLRNACSSAVTSRVPVRSTLAGGMTVFAGRRRRTAACGGVVGVASVGVVGVVGVSGVVGGFVHRRRLRRRDARGRVRHDDGPAVPGPHHADDHRRVRARALASP